jgi:hypothetical protein
VLTAATARLNSGTGFILEPRKLVLGINVYAIARENVVRTCASRLGCIAAGPMMFLAEAHRIKRGAVVAEEEVELVADALVSEDKVHTDATRGLVVAAGSAKILQEDTIALPVAVLRRTRVRVVVTRRAQRRIQVGHASPRGRSTVLPALARWVRRLAHHVVRVVVDTCSQTIAMLSGTQVCVVVAGGARRLIRVGYTPGRGDASLTTIAKAR